MVFGSSFLWISTRLFRVSKGQQKISGGCQTYTWVHINTPRGVIKMNQLAVNPRGLEIISEVLRLSLHFLFILQIVPLSDCSISAPVHFSFYYNSSSFTTQKKRIRTRRWNDATQQILYLCISHLRSNAFTEKANRYLCKWCIFVVYTILILLLKVVLIRHLLKC